MKVLVTGGSGFIGQAVIHQLLTDPKVHVVNLDKLTYAAVPGTLAELSNEPRYRFEHANICDTKTVRRILSEHSPHGVIHLAAESHVDRSIDGPKQFVTTNIVGTFVLLNETLRYWRKLSVSKQAVFRFHQVSTDEVYGSLGSDGQFQEDSCYKPNSPYAASKASADHLARAWYHTFGLPVIISNASNNYGPYQYPEKLIPRSILSALHDRPIEIYGDGHNVRDWLFVEDHAAAIKIIFERAEPGESYNVGGSTQHTNLEVVHKICESLDSLQPSGSPYDRLVTHVDDRPGHDFRYDQDSSRLKQKFGVEAATDFSVGLRRTVSWYLDNEVWWSDIWKTINAGRRLGQTLV